MKTEPESQTAQSMLVDNTINVDGVNYYDSTTFAKLTHRSTQSVRLLIGKGNRIRKLKHIKLNRMILINESELVDFPFACAGKSRVVIYFNVDGSSYKKIIM